MNVIWTRRMQSNFTQENFLKKLKKIFKNLFLLKFVEIINFIKLKKKVNLYDFLFFILNGKRTSCNYGPSARVIDNIISKKLVLKYKSDSISDDKLYNFVRRNNEKTTFLFVIRNKR